MTKFGLFAQKLCSFQKEQFAFKQGVLSLLLSDQGEVAGEETGNDVVLQSQELFSQDISDSLGKPDKLVCAPVNCGCLSAVSNLAVCCAVVPLCKFQLE